MTALFKTGYLKIGCGSQWSPVIGTVYLSKRSESRNVVVKGQHDNLAAYKRGRGGRSSFSGIVATVLGSTGFMGRYVVNRLGKIGSQVICPYRGDPYFSRELKLAGDLGQILFMPYSINDEESLRKVMKYSNVVINLVGADIETKNFSFKDVNTTGAMRIARIAKEMGVERFIHMSHLNASAEPQSIFMREGSEFLKSKYHGEMAVRNEFPEAVVFKPADIFGAEDRFLHYYGNSRRRTALGMPVWKLGTQTIKMPVFCSDVAEGIINAAMDPETDGKTYECVGPQKYLLSELIDYFYRCMRFQHYNRIPMNPAFQAIILASSFSPFNEYWSLDKLEREHVSDVLQGHSTLEDLNVVLQRLEERAIFELKLYSKFRHHEEAVGEFADPQFPEAYKPALF